MPPPLEQCATLINDRRADGVVLADIEFVMSSPTLIDLLHEMRYGMGWDSQDLAREVARVANGITEVKVMGLPVGVEDSMPKGHVHTRRRGLEEVSE